MRKLIVLALLCVSMTSCTRKISLDYSPVMSFQKKNCINLHVENFEDCRENNDKLGVARNLYWMPIVKFHTQDNLSYWVKNALEIELENSGYSLTEELQDVYVIEGRINEVYFDTYLCCSGRINVDMSVRKNGDIIFQKTYQTSEWSGFSRGAETLKFNLQELCKQFINDLNCQLNGTLAENPS